MKIDGGPLDFDLLVIGVREASMAGDVIYARDSRQMAVRILQIRYAGATIVIDRSGRKLYRDGRATSFDTLKSAVERALKS